MPGADTGSCTDGPRGPHRLYTLAHAVDPRTWTLLVSRPHPRRGWQQPAPFVSIPGSLAEVDGAPAMVADAIEIGGEAFRIERGVELLAALIGDLLLEGAHARGLPVFIPAAARGDLAQRVIHSITRQFTCSARTCTITLDTRALSKVGIRRIYSDLSRTSCGIALRDTGRRLELPALELIELKVREVSPGARG